MRCFRVALKVAASAVPLTALAFVWCEPASAHAHHYSYRHVHAHSAHYGGRHLYAMVANNSAGTGFSSQYFGSPYSGPRDFRGYRTARSASYDNVSTMAASQAGTAGLPDSLVERIIRRESGGNSRAVHAGNYGLMQIRLGTARAMGYTGSAAGLLDPAPPAATRAARSRFIRAAITTRPRRRASRLMHPAPHRARASQATVRLISLQLRPRCRSRLGPPRNMASDIAGIITCDRGATSADSSHSRARGNPD